MTTSHVQISVETAELLIESLTGAIKQNAEDYVNQAVALEAAGDEIREMAARITELEFEGETLNNALAMRGRLLDTQQDEIRKLERKLDEILQERTPKVGDKVRAVRDTESMFGWKLAAGEVVEVGPPTPYQAEGRTWVLVLAERVGRFVPIEDLEVVA